MPRKSPSTHAKEGAARTSSTTSATSPTARRLPNTHPHRTPRYGQLQKPRHRHPATGRGKQHRRSTPPHRTRLHPAAPTPPNPPLNSTNDFAGTVLRVL